MSTIIDRRLNGKNKSSPNRRKFFRRAKDAIREAVNKRISDEKIKDTATGGTKVRVKQKTVDEPTFRNSRDGKKQGVHPGNKEYQKGEELKRPPKERGGRGKQGSDDGLAEDDFIFTVNREEFLEVLFENLALPDLVKTSLINIEEYKMRRAGHTTSGSPANLNIIRSIESSLMRRSALEGSIEDDIEEKKKELRELEESSEFLSEELGWTNGDAMDKLRREIAELEKEEVPYIDDVDIRYNVHVKEPNPSNNAVMFCIMDVSVSMGEFEKMLAKKFFLLLYLFLEREYDNIDIVFIRYYHEAEEVDEDDFWNKVTSGGTITSKGIRIANQIVKDRYPTADWNIYVAHASDGDNFSNDRQDLLYEMNHLLPALQYFAYVQVGENIRRLWGMGDGHTELWEQFEELKEKNPQLATALVEEEKQIWPVFRSLFEKREENASS